MRERTANRRAEPAWRGTGPQGSPPRRGRWHFDLETFATLRADMPRTRKGRSRGSRAGTRARPNPRLGRRAKRSWKDRRASKILRWWEARVLLNKDYTVALADLHRAGLHRISSPGVPGWYHLQRYTVAILRQALAHVEQALHDARAATAQEPLGRGPTRLADHHFALRVREAECLLKLRDRAQEYARVWASWARTLPTEDERRLATARGCKEIPRLVSEWDQEVAWLMSTAPAPARPV